MLPKHIQRVLSNSVRSNKGRDAVTVLIGSRSSYLQAGTYTKIAQRSFHLFYDFCYRSCFSRSRTERCEKGGATATARSQGWRTNAQSGWKTLAGHVDSSFSGKSEGCRFLLFEFEMGRCWRAWLLGARLEKRMVVPEMRTRDYWMLRHGFRTVPTRTQPAFSCGLKNERVIRYSYWKGE